MARGGWKLFAEKDHEVVPTQQRGTHTSNSCKARWRAIFPMKARTKLAKMLPPHITLTDLPTCLEIGFRPPAPKEEAPEIGLKLGPTEKIGKKVAQSLENT